MDEGVNKEGRFDLMRKNIKKESEDSFFMLLLAGLIIRSK